MGQLVNRDAFPYQIDKTIEKMVKSSYIEYKSELNSLVKDADAPVKGKEFTKAELSGLTLMREVAEGAGVEFDVPAEGNKKSIYFKQVGGGFVVTEIMLEDELFGHMKTMGQSLAEAARYYEDLDIARIFALGNTSAVTAWDGQYLFDTDHTNIKAGTTSSNLGAVALSESALQAAYEAYLNMVSPEGRPIQMEPDTLLVTNKNWVLAKRLMTQMFGISPLGANSTTGNADVGNSQLNMMKPGAGVMSYDVMKSAVLSQLLPSGTGFWLLSKKDLDIRMVYKRKFKLQMANDDRTGNRLYRGTMRYALGAFNWRGAYGSYA